MSAPAVGSAELLELAKLAAEAVEAEAVWAELVPLDAGCAGCGCVRVVIGHAGLVCALCGAPS